MKSCLVLVMAPSIAFSGGALLTHGTVFRQAERRWNATPPTFSWWAG